MGSPLSREEVLDELGFLATVEHALVVEYLSVFCALGHDLEADEGGATTDEGRNAASAASTLAMDEMFRLRNISFGLVDAGRVRAAGTCRQHLERRVRRNRARPAERGPARTTTRTRAGDRFGRRCAVLAVGSSGHVRPGVRGRPPRPTAAAHRRRRANARFGARATARRPGGGCAGHAPARDPPGGHRLVRAACSRSATEAIAWSSPPCKSGSRHSRACLGASMAGAPSPADGRAASSRALVRNKTARGLRRIRANGRAAAGRVLGCDSCGWACSISLPTTRTTPW